MKKLLILKLLIKVLHITPHLGGGVGRALVSLCAANKLEKNSKIVHSFICLENLEKDQFAKEISALGSDIFIQPGIDDIKHLIDSADIVQLEWWNHPATLFTLCKLQDTPMRLIIWCHQSGIGNIAIPIKLIKIANKFLLTSACSYEVEEINDYKKLRPESIEVISSGAGFERLPRAANRTVNTNDYKLGYVGTLNFSKLHPNFIKLISCLPSSNKVKVFGDMVNKDLLEQECQSVGKAGLLEFKGYSTNIYEDLKKLDILLYLLNPEHYGTAEIALLEAMAMGVVPIVMNNPAERLIVQDGLNGFVVNSQLELSERYHFLRQHPELLLKMSRKAEMDVRSKFTLPLLYTKFSRQYNLVIKEKKRTFDFIDSLGKGPSEWFLSCYRKKSNSQSSKIVDSKSSEMTKGSIHHYLKYFPEDDGLKKIAELTQLP